MRLNEYDVANMLHDALDFFLQNKSSFEMLRKCSLNIQPIRPVEEDLLRQWVVAAESDKIDEMDRLTKTMHQRQMQEDQDEAVADRALTYKNGIEIGRIQQAITAQDSANQNTQQQIVNLSARLADLVIELGSVTVKSNDGLSSNELEVVHRLMVTYRERIQRDIETVKKEINSCHLTLATGHSSIVALQSQYSTWLAQEKWLQTREEARVERNRHRIESPFSAGALTTTHATELQQKINTRCAAIDLKLSEMQRQANEMCHPAFLNRLEYHLQQRSLQLPDVEYSALMHIVAQMRIYIIDLVALEKEQQAYTQLLMQLQTQRELQSSARELLNNLGQQNAPLIQKNTELAQKNDTLLSEKDQALARLDLFLNITLALSLVHAVGAALYVLLVATMAVAMVSQALIPVIAIIAGAIICSPLIASGVFWCLALMKQSNIKINQSTMDDNTKLIEQTAKQIASIADQTLPEIDTAMALLTQKVSTEEQSLHRAEQIAHQSLAEAIAVSVQGESAVNTTSITQGGFNLFASAPPVPPPYAAISAAPYVQLITNERVSSSSAFGPG